MSENLLVSKGRVGRRKAMPAYEFVRDILDVYMDETAHKKKPRTLETDRGAARWLEEMFKGYWLGPQMPDHFALLSKRIVKNAVREMQEEVSDSRICRVLAVGSCAVSYFARERSVDLTNPFRDQIKSDTNKRERYLTETEEKALLLAAGPWLRGVIAFALNTGFRVTEILELTWDRVKGDEVIFTPKTQKSGRHRRRALNDSALYILGRQENVCDHVFTLNGEPVKRRALHELWSEARDRAGITDLIFHDLRRTCGQRMLEGGASITEVQAQLGHEDSKTTEKSYTSPSVRLAKQGVSRMRGVSLEGFETPAVSA